MYEVLSSHQRSDSPMRESAESLGPEVGHDLLQSDPVVTRENLEIFCTKYHEVVSRGDSFFRRERTGRAR